MYHHHLITRDDKETIKKIYYKEKESNLKDDWYQTLKTDLETYLKKEYQSSPRLNIAIISRRKLKRAAFTLYMGKKETHKKKPGDIKYDTFKIQPYMPK